MTPPLPPALLVPHPTRLDPRRPDFAVIMARHAAAIASGAAQYVDPATGYLVFTAEALWNRGECCDTGCRHCPFIERPSAARE